MNLLKLLLLPLCIFATLTTDAQRWSYIYIQGDKQIPFYLKLEGEMLPRYSKNYYIIPQLEAGPIHLQILFQQNEYPAQNFTVLVPESGARGFLLSRKDNTFALYDIQQRFYLYSGDNGEDHLPEMMSLNTLKENSPATAPKVKASSKQTEKTVLKPERETNKRTPVAQVAETANEPQFIEDVVLENEHDGFRQTELPLIAETEQEVSDEERRPEPRQHADNTPEKQYSSEQQQSPIETVDDGTVNPEQIEIESNTAPIINSDCPQPLNDEEFDKIYSSTKDKGDDERRVSYLMKKAESNCFTSRQAYFLAREMKAESMRYSFLKKVYPRITDQQNFRLLEGHLFRTLEWKSYFRLIYQ